MRDRTFTLLMLIVPWLGIAIAALARHLFGWF